MSFQKCHTKSPHKQKVRNLTSGESPLNVCQTITSMMVYTQNLGQEYLVISCSKNSRLTFHFLEKIWPWQLVRSGSYIIQILVKVTHCQRSVNWPTCWSNLSQLKFDQHENTWPTCRLVMNCECIFYFKYRLHASESNFRQFHSDSNSTPTSSNILGLIPILESRNKCKNHSNMPAIWCDSTLSVHKYLWCINWYSTNAKRTMKMYHCCHWWYLRRMLIR